MNKNDFLALGDIEELVHKLTIDDLEDKSDRTLLYGYTCDRYTWHVYVENQEIITLFYGFGEMKEVYVSEDRYYVPDKRLYPECCDFEFCALLKERGVHLPFTTFNEDREYSQYYGKLI